MSIGSLSNIGGSVAGTALAQTRGSDVDRSQQETGARELRAQSHEKAEQAAGVGQTDGDDHQTADRDADGRRLWELSRRQGGQEPADGDPDKPRGKDSSGLCGNALDLSG